MAGVPTLIAPPDVGFELTVVDLDPLRAAICAVGEFDLAAKEALADVLQRQVDARRRIVRLDLSLVTFFDCSCLGVLVASHHRFLNLHGMLVLTGVDERVGRILKITGLDDRLFIVPTSDDPFGSVLMARAVRQRVPSQRQSPDLATFDPLVAVASEREPRGKPTRRGRSRQRPVRAAPGDLVGAPSPHRKAAS
jgi:anti-anti-sigma factor